VSPTATSGSGARLGRLPQLDERVWVGTAEVDGDALSLEGALGPWAGREDIAQLLLLEHGIPRAWLYVERAAMDSEATRGRLVRDALASRDATTRRPQGPGQVSMDVVVCTRDRPEQLARCLGRLVERAGTDVGIVVVDNAPRDEAVRNVVDRVAKERPGLRRVVEGRPGLSRARNAGLRASSADVVAFTDDDTVVHEGWTGGLRAAFSYADDVAVVTGLVPPAEIASRSQALFERKVKWSENLEFEIYSMAERERYVWSFPYAAGNFGTGANFAVRRELALSVGGFDEALGAGTRSGSGEDFKMFIQLVRAGYRLVYEPGAIVWHIHRGRERDLRRQIIGYGSGMAACFFALSLEPGRLDMLRGVLHGALALAKTRQSEVSYGLPRRHLVLEALGVVVGPGCYLIDRVTNQRARR
jgi:GT2 family glycosyltransferase